MKVIISPDSYKGTLSAAEVAKAMEEGILEVDQSIETIILPVADGGEGTLESLIISTQGRYLSTHVLDPLGRCIEASYGVLGDGTTCVIEMAQASGIMLLKEHERNPEVATTYGTGQLIKAALDNGYREFIIGIGGSATNDAGMGMLKALGLQFKTRNGMLISEGVSGLLELDLIDDSRLDPRIAESSFVIACDVDNPLVGERGATAVFGPQKGVEIQQIAHFDSCLKQFADNVEKQYGIRLHDYQGAGAAGGVGGALIAFLNATFHAGIDIVMEAVQLKQHLIDAHYVMTGEGKSDRQTLYGKAPMGVAKMAKAAGVKSILLSGVIENTDRALLLEHFDDMDSLVGTNITLQQAIMEPYHFIRLKTRELFGKYM